MTPDEALKTLEEDQAWDGAPVYWWSEYEDGTRFFVIQDGDLLHEYTMDYQGTTRVPGVDEL